MKLLRSITASLLRGVLCSILVGLAGLRVSKAAETAGTNLASQAGAALGTDLYRVLAAEPGNIVISPYSISGGLALLSAGANGTTSDEILQTLHWSPDPKYIPDSFAAQDSQLVNALQSGGYLAVANGLWFQEGNELRRPFLKIAEESFHAEVRAADFIQNDFLSQLNINEWVFKTTKGKIRELLPVGTLNSSTRLVLVNAIYFKGDWENPFVLRATRSVPFFLAPDKSVDAPVMSMSAHLKTVNAGNWDLLELPYRGNGLSMVILLPKRADGLGELEQQLSSSNLKAWLASLDFKSPVEVNVYLPRFKMTYAVGLKKPLEQLGMTTAFTRGRANFSDINGGRDLYLSSVVHKALIEVNESGTVAAAATGSFALTLGMNVPLEYRVDHPFLFLIRDNASGSLLFLGRVSNPLE